MQGLLGQRKGCGIYLRSYHLA